MSASPPPPPPFQSMPNGGTLAGNRWQRRMLRDQRRAATFQARQQRAVFRAQMRAMRRTSIVGPLLLISLGLILLFLEIGRLHWLTLLAWYGHWWPLLLVGAGVILLCEWAIDSWIAPTVGDPLPRRTLGGGAAFLLCALAAAGMLTLGIQNGSTWIRNNLDDDFAATNLFGLDQALAERSEITLDLNAPLANNGLLTIQNHRGNITVTGSSQDGLVHVTARQRIFAWRKEDLAARRRREQPSLTRRAGGLLLAVSGERRDETDLTIEMPHEASVAIEPEHGEVSVTELRGGVNLADHQGNIVLTALTGPVHLSVRDDDANVSGHSLSGGVTLEGRSGDLTFSEITGPLTLRGDFFGKTHLEHINGSVHFQSSFTDLACAGLPGDIEIEGRSELAGKGLTGPVTLTTSDRNLTLNNVRGGASIDDRNGNVKLSLVDPLGPVHVSTTDGSVDLALPDTAAFTLTAKTNDGQVQNDFGLPAQEHEDHATLSGQVRTGGPAVILQTSEGDIHVRKASAADWSDSAEQPGEPDQKLVTPTADPRHVRRSK